MKTNSHQVCSNILPVSSLLDNFVFKIEFDTFESSKIKQAYHAYRRELYSSKTKELVLIFTQTVFISLYHSIYLVIPCSCKSLFKLVCYIRTPSSLVKVSRNDFKDEIHFKAAIYIAMKQLWNMHNSDSDLKVLFYSMLCCSLHTHCGMLLSTTMDQMISFLLINRLKGKHIMASNSNISNQ